MMICAVISVQASMLNMKIEAENTSLTSNTTIVNKEFASNGSFVKLNNSEPQGSLTFNINVNSTDLYKLHVYSFNGGTVVNANLSINGGAIQSVVLQPSNWAYQEQAKLTLLNVNLNEGLNSITFKATSNSNVLLDYFIITEYFNDYYVSSSGDDTNNGSVNTPWKTLAKASAVAAKSSGGGILNPGDRLFFKRGDSFEGNFEVKCVGSEEKPITISSYGAGELPVISGSGNIAGGDYFEAIKLVNASHIVMSDLWIQNDRKNNTRYTFGETNSYGIRVVANKWGGVSSGLTFRNLKISNVYGVSLPAEFNELSVTGLRFESEMNEPNVEVSIKNVLIEDSYFTKIGKAGVWAIHKGLESGSNDAVNRNADFIIRNNTFYRTGGSGVILSKMLNARVENNDFDHTGYSNGIETRLAGRGSGMWVFKCVNILGQYNRSVSVRGPNDSYGMHIDFGNKNIIYQYNYSEDSEGGFVEVLGDNHNVAYRFNVSVNDGIRDFHGSTIWTSGYVGTGNTPIPSDDVYVYNNTIFLGANQKPDFSLFSEDTYIYNNIFMQTGNGIIGENVDIDIRNGGELVVANNLFHGNINSSFSILDTSPISGNPNFVNQGATNKEGYKISSNSPVIDAGKNFPEPNFPMAGQGIFSDISLHPTEDMYGNTIDIATFLPNVGADNNYNNWIDPTNIPVTGVTISNQNGVLIPGDSQNLTATVSPLDALNKAVTWSCSNSSVATVDANGKVTAVSVGTAIITVETNDGGFTASTLVTVDSEFSVTLMNGDFEQGLTHWNSWNNPTGVAGGYYGDAIKLTGPSSINQWVKVQPNTTYTLSAYAKVDDPQNDRVVLGVNNHNNNGITNAQIYDTSYTLHKLMFTTSAATDSIKVFFWRPGNGVASSYVDEMVLKETSYVLNSDFEKGTHAWTSWGIATVNTVTSGIYEGKRSLKVSGNGGANQIIKTKPNTSYQVSFYAKVDNPSVHVNFQAASSSGTVYDVKQITNTSYTYHTLNFKTSASDEDTKIGFWRPNGSIGSAFLDKIEIQESLNIQTTNESNFKTLANSIKCEIYPNPARDFLIIETHGIESEMNVEIRNILGKIVLNKKLNTINNSTNTIDLNSLSEGIYIVNLISKQYKTKEKLFIQ